MPAVFPSRQAFWNRRMALDRRNYKALVETTVELGNKVGQGKEGWGRGGEGVLHVATRQPGMCAGVRTCPAHTSMPSWT